MARAGGELIQINNYKETTQSNRLYDSNGLSITLNASGNNGIYMIDDNKGVTTTTTNDFFAITTRCRQMPLSKKQDNYVFEGKSVRRLTPIECERLQGFPDDWTKYGKDNELISDTQRYKCCGNAVTTNVITAIVDEMFDEVK
jgi:DNA (cytosine-5)-methyltransferase 1